MGEGYIMCLFSLSDASPSTVSSHGAVTSHGAVVSHGVVSSDGVGTSDVSSLSSLTRTDYKHVYHSTPEEDSVRPVLYRDTVSNSQYTTLFILVVSSN